jgi:hypothetical protein
LLLGFVPLHGDSLVHEELDHVTRVLAHNAHL